jgi:hypothetical protein
MQTTQIGQNISAKEETLCGVPQGSILGPLLFLIYINDIYNSSEKLKFYLFADDTNLIYADKNLKSLEIVVNTELSKIHNWLIANKLSLNTTSFPGLSYEDEARHEKALVWAGQFCILIGLHHIV